MQEYIATKDVKLYAISTTVGIHKLILFDNEYCLHVISFFVIIIKNYLLICFVLAGVVIKYNNIQIVFIIH